MNNPNTDSTRPRSVHVVPYHSIGGVEIAARSLGDGLHNGFAFRKLYLVSKDEPAAGTSGRLKACRSGDYVCGILVKNQSAKGFASAVMNMVKANQSAIKMAQTARQGAISSYSQAKMFSGYASLLKND